MYGGQLYSILRSHVQEDSEYEFKERLLEGISVSTFLPQESDDVYMDLSMEQLEFLEMVQEQVSRESPNVSKLARMLCVILST